MTTAEVLKYLGCSKYTLSLMVSEGIISVVKLPGQKMKRYDVRELDRVIDESKTKTGERRRSSMDDFLKSL